MSTSSQRVACILAALVLPAMSVPASDRIERGNFVGRTLPPYPAGLQELQGACLAGGPGIAHVCDHSIAVLGHRPSDPARQPVARWVVSSRNVDRAARQPRWLVTDAIEVPKPRAGYELQIGTCRVDGVDAPDIVAFVRHREDEISRDVRWVRRYDLATGKLASVEAGRVDCINEAAGL